MRHVTHVIVRGLVQGVSFRAWTVGQAERSGVDGWVRNREDGGLEAILAGDPDAIRGIVDAFQVGPELAVVTDVIELPTDEDPGQGFHIRV
jgi:acylphosphatase